MKPHYLFLFAALIWSSCDKTSETPIVPSIPDAVVQSIAGKFNQPTDFTITNLQINGLFAADFQAQNNHYQAIISENGTLLALEKELPLTAMPIIGAYFISNKYPNSNIDFLFAELDPVSNATIGYFTKITRAGKGYLLSLDTLGGRISVEEEPDTVWWRYPVRNVDYLQQNMRTEINATQPLGTFLAASLLVDAKDRSRWTVCTVYDSFLTRFEFDGNGTLAQRKLEDLFGLDVPGVFFQDLFIQQAVPVECTNFLDVHFQGWEFQRAIIRYETINGNNVAIEIMVKIKLGQAIYFTHFDPSTNFTGAIRG